MWQRQARPQADFLPVSAISRQLWQQAFPVSVPVSRSVSYTHLDVYKRQIYNWREVRCDTMSNVIVKENETLDSALRRFKRNCAKAGIQQEIRKREHYEKPSVRRKKKSEAARKRKYN